MLTEALDREITVSKAKRQVTLRNLLIKRASVMSTCQV